MDPLLIVIILLVLVIAGLIFKSSRGQHGSPVSAENVATELEPKMLELLGRALESNNAVFTDLAGTKTENLLSPFKSQIANLDKAVNELKTSHDAEKGTVKTLTDQMMDLASSNRSVTESLRSDKISGLWGEASLENVIRSAGLEQHVNFHPQKRGQNLQQKEYGQDEQSRKYGVVDAEIVLPNGACIAIDAKVPTPAWIKQQENKELNDKEKKQAIDDYVGAFKGHIDDLSGKKYWEHEKDRAAFDLVVMYLPHESLLRDAFSAEKELFDYAAKRNVTIATPLTLLALLSAIKQAWRGVQLMENVAEIKKEAQKLNRWVVNFVGAIGDIGKQLSKTVDEYNGTITKYRTLTKSLEKFESFEVWNEEIPEVDPIEKTVNPIPDKE